MTTSQDPPRKAQQDALLADLQMTSVKDPALSQPSPSCGQYDVPSMIAPPKIQTNKPASVQLCKDSERKEMNKTIPSVKMQTPPTSKTNPRTQRPVVDAPKPKSADPATAQVSALSNNLSELDSLLQELSSAQFSAEIERRNAATLPHSFEQSNYSQIKMNQDRSVDSLLSELDDSRYHGPSSCMASTATRELDDLMASLSTMTNVAPSKNGLEKQNPSDAQVCVPESGQLVPKPTAALTVGSQLLTHSMMVGAVKPSSGVVQNVNLNMLMEDLNTQMKDGGILTIPKGHCAACAKPIVGEVITALARLWHPEHFTCVHCRCPIGTRNFFERDGQPYCEKDYHVLFSPQCASCNGPVLDKCVMALDKTWHPEHFCCAQCKKQLDDEEGFHERDGKLYCRADFFEQFAPKCGRCEGSILENFISALNRQWHPQCFVCFECQSPFGLGSFFENDGLPYCETHYHAKRGSLCSSCHKPITGRCITAKFKKFHPEHFVCTFCQKQLSTGTFKEQSDKPYCQSCFIRLFS